MADRTGTSGTRVFAILELLDLILSNLTRSHEGRGDLARCARVNKLWHQRSIRILWSGEPDGRHETVPLHAFEVLMNDPDHSRWTNYASHIQHLRYDFCSTKSPDLHLKPSWDDKHWSICPLVYLYVWSEDKNNDKIRVILPASLFGPQLRAFESDLFMAEENLRMLMHMPLRWLSIKVDAQNHDVQQTLSRLLRAQKHLVGLELFLEPDDHGPHKVDLAVIAGTNVSRDIHGCAMESIQVSTRNVNLDQALKRLEYINIRTDDSLLSAMTHSRMNAPLRTVRLSAPNMLEAVDVRHSDVSVVLDRLSCFPTLEDICITDYVCTSDAVDVALVELARACPLLWRFNVITESFFVGMLYFNHPIKQESVVSLAECCPLLIDIAYELPMEGEVATNIEAVLRQQPNIQKLSLCAKELDLRELCHMDLGDTKPALKTLWVMEILSSVFAPDQAEAAVLLEALMDRLPNLKWLVYKLGDVDEPFVELEDVDEPFHEPQFLFRDWHHTLRDKRANVSVEHPDKRFDDQELKRAIIADYLTDARSLSNG